MVSTSWQWGDLVTIGNEMCRLDPDEGGKGKSSGSCRCWRLREGPGRGEQSRLIDRNSTLLGEHWPGYVNWGQAILRSGDAPAG